MTETYTVVLLEELTRLEITCPGKDCGTRIEFDPVVGRAPSKCPSCGLEFGSMDRSLHRVAQSYRSFYEEITKYGLQPRFKVRVAPPDAAPK